MNFTDHQAFATSWLFLLDTARCILILLDGWLIFWILYTARKVLPSTRQWGCFALATFMLLAIIDNFARLGTGFGVTIICSIVGTFAAGVYITQVRGLEKWYEKHPK